MKKRIASAFLFKRIIFAVIGFLRYICLKSVCVSFPGSGRIHDRISILMYHYIKKSDTSIFKKHISVFSRFSMIESLDALSLPESRGERLFITFDDGYASILENAIPLLHHHHINAAIFIPTGYIGRKPDWSTNHLYHMEDEIIMNEEQIKAASRFCEIGSHGISHSDMCAMPAEQCFMELTRSKKILESICEKEISSFSFPFGKYNDHIVILAREAGYRHFFSTRPVTMKKGSLGTVFGRFEAFPFDTSFEILLKCYGSYEWLSGFMDMKRRILERLRPRLTPILIHDEAQQVP